MRALGVPLEGQAGVGYSLKPGFFLPSLAFSQEELDAVMLGLDWVKQRADPALARCGESALAKILSARKHGDGAGTGMAPPVILTAASTSEAVNHPQTAVLRDVIRRQCKLAIGYADAQDTPSERIAWPIALDLFRRRTRPGSLVRAPLRVSAFSCRSIAGTGTAGNALPAVAPGVGQAMATTGPRLAFVTDSF